MEEPSLNGTLDNHKYPQECNRADRMKSVLVGGCNAGDSIACKLLLNMTQVEAAADFADAGKTAKELAGD